MRVREDALTQGEALPCVAVHVRATDRAQKVLRAGRNGQRVRGLEGEGDAHAPGPYARKTRGSL